jgi:hypothetical protein
MSTTDAFALHGRRRWAVIPRIRGSGTATLGMIVARKYEQNES